MSRLIKNRKAIIVANGGRPSKNILRKLINNGYDTIVAADGGANFLFEMGIIPDIIIGDLDSLSSSTLERINPESSKLLRIKRQNDTDVEKSIKYLIKKKFKQTVLIGVDGNRIDHLLGNLSLGLKYVEIIKINIISGNSVISFLGSSTNVAATKGERVSIFGFQEEGEILSDGLKYSLEGLELIFGKQDSISNIATNSKVELKIKKGKFILVTPFNSFIRHGNSQ